MRRQYRGWQLEQVCGCGSGTNRVVLLVEAARHVALGLRLDVEGDEEGGRDEDEEGGGNNAEDVHALSNLGELLRYQVGRDEKEAGVRTRVPQQRRSVTCERRFARLGGGGRASDEGHGGGGERGSVLVGLDGDSLRHGWLGEQITPAEIRRRTDRGAGIGSYPTVRCAFDSAEPERARLTPRTLGRPLR